jgi:hypothetical protein
MKTPTKIFLADLAHTHAVADRSLSVPLNIGFIKAYSVAAHSDSVDIRLFKHPEKLLKELLVERPEIVGLSNYTWNSNLNIAVGRYIREVLPECLIIVGGPNIDDEENRRLI